MKILIHDLDDFNLKGNLGDIRIIEKSNKIHNCIGCFGCWIKTPAECIIKDSYNNLGEYMSKSEEVIVVSKCVYGGFSPFVKNVFDRSISYIHPYFQMRNGEMHHRRRYKNVLKLTVWFYGDDITSDEKKTAERIVEANAVNFDGTVNKISFVKSISELEDILI